MRSLAVAAVVCPVLALANGRAPLTNGVQFRPGDPHSIYVATTFGLLVSHDDGCSFRMICERNIGYGGTFDPKYRIAADGTIFATTFTGLRVSRDGGCTFTTATAGAPAGAPGRIAELWIDAIDIGPGGDVWVATAESGKPNNVYRSTDNARTFEPRGLGSPSIWWKTIAIAASRPQRIYATGYQVAGARAGGGQLPPTAHFEISDDDGAHWTESPLAGVRFGATPLVYVAGVDRANPDVVLMSSVGANPPGGDRLYRSSDGGATWTEVLAAVGPILDVALAPRGKVVVATLGGGAFVSSDGGAAFAPMPSPPQLACVRARDDGLLYGCAANWAPDGKALARSSDGTTWDKVLRFAELAGPLACPAGTPQHDTCAAQWPAVQHQFGATAPTGCPAPPVAADPPPSPPPTRRPTRRTTGGCCNAGSGSPGELAAIGMLVALCCAWARHRRRR